MAASLSSPPRRRWRPAIISLLLIALAVIIGYRFHKDAPMPPPFVYLIPEDYFGPVVTFFGQPDGIEMMPDPLGHAVEVPETGIIKVRAGRQEVMGITDEQHQATYFVSVANDGTRTPIKFLSDVYREDGIFWQGVISDNLQITRYDIGPDAKGNYDHLPTSLHDERMISNRQNCKFRFRNADEASKETDCDEFLIVSPNERIATLDWLWGHFSSQFTSMDSFISTIEKIQDRKSQCIEELITEKREQQP